MMVDFPDPEGPTSAVTVPGSEREADFVQHGLAGVVLEVHVLEGDVALNRVDLAHALGVFILGPLGEHFLGAVESGERLGQLRTDADHLQHRRHQEGQVPDEGRTSRRA